MINPVNIEPKEAIAHPGGHLKPPMTGQPGKGKKDKRYCASGDQTPGAERFLGLYMSAGMFTPKVGTKWSGMSKKDDLVVRVFIEVSRHFFG